ncbi:uncharacterized protein LOC125500718 isoform X2 [Athalia rosae]|uniref:uncharacterized protein LOC125500718 isoform X2 n=1 Tax=Athalia rosae TaxID=37344 RepID=UPI002033CC57|nr:uncharacterized protein LOC125500718 isoform X2 [Athalia rosae]
MSSAPDEDLLQIMPEECYWLGATPSQFSHSQSIESATNYAAFLDYSHRLSQEWLHPIPTPQELQAAFIEQPSLFYDSNALLGHEHLTYGGYPCPAYDQNRSQTPNTCPIGEGSLNQLMEANEQKQANAKQQSVVKRNDKSCVPIDECQAQQLEKKS